MDKANWEKSLKTFEDMKKTHLDDLEQFDMFIEAIKKKLETFNSDK
jgi:hypothetical protein